MQTAEQKLVRSLSDAASYNDKGFEWCGHSPTKVKETQSRFHQNQLDLAREVGADRLGEELLVAIENGAASRDWSGKYARLAKHELGVSI